MKILLVDDDIYGRMNLKGFLAELGHEVIEADDGHQAIDIYRSNDIHMILTDLRMPGMSGMELIKHFKAIPNFQADVVFITGHGGMDSAIEALRLGAYDYMTKPLNVEEMAMLVERVAEHQSLIRENQLLTREFDSAVIAATRDTLDELDRYKDALIRQSGIGLIGAFSEAMLQAIREARRLHADRSIPVLVQGETGTGKEVLARLIHYGEPPSTAPFIDINCAALSPSLFESELFGYEAGSYTGGIPKGQKGKFDLASGGTLFLDEISELSPPLQAKLLRVIQEKEYYRVGGLKKIATDVRIVCATNSDLALLVDSGAFRSDLYYRLNVASINIPPLRERRDEIVPLAEMFVDELTRQKGKAKRTFSSDARRMLEAHSWPGNVRELKNAMEWLVFSGDETLIEPVHLRLGRGLSLEGELRSEDESNLLRECGRDLPDGFFPLEEHITSIITRAMRKHDGNKTAAARYLGISRRVLEGRLRHINTNQEEPNG